MSASPRGKLSMLILTVLNLLPVAGRFFQSLDDQSRCRGDHLDLVKEKASTQQSFLYSRLQPLSDHVHCNHVLLSTTD